VVDPQATRKQQPARIVLAWGVHFYTALGLVLAAAIAVLIVRGEASAFQWAFGLMFIATVIDSTDGTLARLVRVKEVLPGFDGRRLDDIVDFLTYTFLPLFLLWRSELLPGAQAYWLLVPLLASAYGFCQVSAKTEDGYFLGFPSYWNLVAFYLWVLQPPNWISLCLLLGLAILTFVPLRYLYPSQGGALNRLTYILGVIWAGLLIGILIGLPPEGPFAARTANHPIQWMALLSLVFPLYYLAASWAVSIKLWLSKRARA
jgi:phosphatidylcholine synthase